MRILSRLTWPLLMMGYYLLLVTAVTRLLLLEYPPMGMVVMEWLPEALTDAGQKMRSALLMVMEYLNNWPSTGL